MRDEEKMHVTITLDKHIMMHVVYWIIIITLGVLLAMSWMKDCEPNDTTGNTVVEEAEDLAQDVVEDVEEEIENIVETEETCSDGIKNQDETDVDCGGSCGGCASGKSCDTASDCLADYCTDGKCSSKAPVVLSGDVDLSVTDYDIVINNMTDAVKVTEVSFSIDNGYDKDLGPVSIKVFLKSKKSGAYCLSQPSGEETDCPNPYAEWTATGPRSGKKQTYTQDLTDVYFGPSYVSNYGSSSYYQNGDDFQLFIYVYDDSGSLIEGEEVSAFKTVTV